ncbi:hypothetical protein [Flavobacterium piscis]|uniref:Uncharacterized protein n=1 Tax=Flavobacterium piscis TaxID=1114874 RepID=A0ABX2XG88_9FLAO|nr:hypothetical protein [Flavobacterium piscis]OCB70901.1 hypothetical protein FLP_17290 [Flavobacterium piscis]
MRLFQNKANKKGNLRALAPSWQNSLKPPKTGKTQQKQPKIKKLRLVKTTQPTTYKKDGKYIIKRLVNVNKGSTFAPATATDVL